MEKKVKTAPKTKKVAVSKTKPEVSLGDRVKQKYAKVLAIIKTKISEAVHKFKQPRKKAKKLTKQQQILAKEQRNRGILGIGLLLVVVSITFSTFIAHTFVDDWKLWIALAPQIAFAAITLIKAFLKLYK